MTRDQSIVAGYLAGETLDALGRAHGLTRSRIGQIVWLWGPADAKARSIAARGGLYSPEARARFRARCPRKEAHPERNRDIVALRAEGWSFSEVAKRVGVTRMTVAGVAYRAAHRKAANA